MAVLGVVLYYSWYKNERTDVFPWRGENLPIVGSIQMSDGTCINFLPGHKLGLFSDFSGSWKKGACPHENAVAVCTQQKDKYMMVFYRNSTTDAESYCKILNGIPDSLK